MANLDLTLWPFLIALAFSLLATPVTIEVFRIMKWVVDPKKQPHPAHLHQKPIPKGGGVPTVMAVILTSLLLLKIDKHLSFILVGLLITLAIGLIDDIKPVNPYVRLVGNFFAALIVIGGGIGIAFVTNPLGGGTIDLSHPRINLMFGGDLHQIWLLADIFALLWIPFVMNAINWSSGLDGQVSGVVAIAAAVIGFLSLNYGADITQWSVAVLAFALAGSYAGFSLFHFYPQKIMPGYSGTSTAGFLLAVLAILATAKVGTALVVLGLPLIDAVYAGIRRMAAGKSPVWGDRGHLHHKLMDMGWGRRKVALFYWSITAILGIIALNTNAEMKLFAILGLAIIILGILLWAYFGPWSKQSDRASG